MIPLMNALHEDHQHIRSLLTLLRNKLATLELGRPVNYTLMAEVVDYLCEYGDRFHHRKEAGIFDFLRRWYPETASQVARQLEEHRELEAITAEIAKAVARVRRGELEQGDAFTRLLRRFIDKQLRHLTREEETLFPLIERTLTPDNWMQFQAEMPALQDRDGEARLALRYQAVCDALLRDLG